MSSSRGYGDWYAFEKRPDPKELKKQYASSLTNDMYSRILYQYLLCVNGYFDEFAFP